MIAMLYAKSRRLMFPLAALLVGLLGACINEGVADKGKVLDLEISGKSDSLLTMDSLEIIVFSKDSSDSQVVLRGRLRDKNQLMGIPLNPEIGEEYFVSVKGFKAGRLTVVKEVAVNRGNKFVVIDKPIKTDSLPVDSLPMNSQPQLEIPADTSILEGENLLVAVKVSKAVDAKIEIKARDLPRGSSLRMNGRYEAEFSWEPEFDQARETPYAITFTTTSGGLALERTLRIRVHNVNRPPVLVPIRNHLGKENEKLAIGIMASDPDGEAGLSLTAYPLPRGAGFAGDTLTWVPGFDQEGTYYVTIKAWDGEQADSQSIAITVGDFNRPPDLEVADTTLSENESLDLWLTAKDPDGKRPTVRMENAPKGASLTMEDSGAGKWRFSWKPDFSQGRPVPYEVTFIARDDSLETRKTSKITVKHVNRPPTAKAGQDTTVTVNDLIVLQGSGTDSDAPMAKWEWNCGGTGSFIQVSKPDTTVNAPGIAMGAYRCILRATDSDGATALDTLVVKVTDEAPSAKAGPDTTADPYSEFRLRGFASDDGRLVEAGWACDGTGSISPTLNGREATFRITATDDTLYRCVFRVKDDDGRTAADTLNIKVKLNWVKATDSAGFPARTNAATVVFRDRIWIIGGRGDGDANLMDVWSS
ncbi:MAG TPA: putative Ig domain-containing protein, partial [Fibrobacteria bacterium]|nr:putative Ig domain-containing protein [Fibrobacteria bacterium]